MDIKWLASLKGLMENGKTSEAPIHPVMQQSSVSVQSSISNTKDNSMTVKIQIGPNGLPLAPEGWFETGKWSIAPDGNSLGVPAGSYFSVLDPVNTDGTIELTVPPINWQASPTGLTLLATINKFPGPPPIAVSAKAAPTTSTSVVPGRTIAEAIALGDVWGFTADPSAH